MWQEGYQGCFRKVNIISIGLWCQLLRAQVQNHGPLFQVCSGVLPLSSLADPDPACPFELLTSEMSRSMVGRESALFAKQACPPIGLAVAMVKPIDSVIKAREMISSSPSLPQMPQLKDIPTGPWPKEAKI